MSELVVVAVVAAVPATVAALASLVAARRVAKVHATVDDGLTFTRKELRAARREVKRLEQKLRERV